jgi:hypothetical protein
VHYSGAVALRAVPVIYAREVEAVVLAGAPIT